MKGGEGILSSVALEGRRPAESKLDLFHTVCHFCSEREREQKGRLVTEKVTGQRLCTKRGTKPEHGVSKGGERDAWQTMRQDSVLEAGQAHIRNKGM